MPALARHWRAGCGTPSFPLDDVRAGDEDWEEEEGWDDDDWDDEDEWEDEDEWDEEEWEEDVDEELSRPRRRGEWD